MDESLRENLKDNENFIQNKYGHCYYCVCDGCAMLFNLYVEKEHRRKGHAKEIINLVVGEIRKLGYTKEIQIVACPREESISREDLVSFYVKMGLSVGGRQHEC
jgi:GNAT superfamily N-acetyltransferase